MDVRIGVAVVPLIFRQMEAHFLSGVRRIE